MSGTDRRKVRAASGLTSLALLALILVTSGCGVVTIGAPLAAKAYRDNTTLEVVVDCYHTEALNASVVALEELDMIVESERVGEQNGRVVGRTSWGESVTVEAAQENGQNSMLSIRVGLMGDVGLSWDIYRNIKRNLYRNGLIQFASFRPEIATRYR